MCSVYNWRDHDVISISGLRGVSDTAGIHLLLPGRHLGRSSLLSSTFDSLHLQHALRRLAIYTRPQCDLIQLYTVHRKYTGKKFNTAESAGCWFWCCATLIFLQKYARNVEWKYATCGMPNIIKIDPHNFELYGTVSKLGHFLEIQCIFSDVGLFICERVCFQCVLLFFCFSWASVWLRNNKFLKITCPERKG